MHARTLLGRGAGPGRSVPERRRPGTGFTLIEVLVVIAVLAVLAGLLTPALARAKSRARSLVCLHHLRQWVLGGHLYAADHEDRLPPEGAPNPTERHTNTGWYIQLPAHLQFPRYHAQPWRTNADAVAGRTVWLCPANPRRSNGRNLFHYCLNQHLDGTGEEDHPARLTAFEEPARTVWWFDSKNLPAVGYWGYTATNLHADGAQFSFLDGHVARFRTAEYWDAAANRGRSNSPALRWLP